MAYEFKWLYYGNKRVATSSGKQVGKDILPANTFRFRFSDASFDPSSITPSHPFSCASSFTWKSLGNGVWDCLLTKKSGYTNSFKGAFHGTFQDIKIGYKPVELIDTCDTSNVTDMSLMFYNCSNLTAVSLFDTSNVTDMSYFLSGCSRLTVVPLFDTSNATNMSNMFSGCSGITSVPLFDTSNVTDMSYMFEACRGSLTTVPLFNTSNVTNMSYMFYDCSNLTSVPLFNTSKVLYMSWMFYNCTSLITVPLFDTSKVDSMGNMFRNCTSLITVPLFDTSKVYGMGNMFYNCLSVTGGALALYQQASSQTNPPYSYGDAFTACGANTTSGYAELQQIPQSWGGLANG